MIRPLAWRRPILGKAYQSLPGLYRVLPLRGPGDPGTLPVDTFTTADAAAALNNYNQPYAPPVPSPSAAIASSLANQQIALPAAPSSSFLTTLTNDLTSLARPVVNTLTTPYYNAKGQLINPLTGNAQQPSLSGTLAAIGPTGLVIGGVLIVGLIVMSNRK